MLQTLSEALWFLYAIPVDVTSLIQVLPPAIVATNELTIKDDVGIGVQTTGVKSRPQNKRLQYLALSSAILVTIPRESGYIFRSSKRSGGVT
jgi:hypothetical protein